MVSFVCGEVVWKLRSFNEMLHMLQHFAIPMQQKQKTQFSMLYPVAALTAF